MNMKILNCGECPLRQGKYMCLGLDRMKDAGGIKRHIEDHGLRPKWCPLPIKLVKKRARAEKKKGKDVEKAAAQEEAAKKEKEKLPPANPRRSGGFFGGGKKK